MRILKNSKTNLFDNAADFFRLGVGHILSGMDHILFVLSMLLVFATITELLQLTSAFTVAHSITLILAGTGILVLSPRISEPLIALSIAVMALASVFLERGMFSDRIRAKLSTVFFFGLFHGLGFAGLLQEISIPDDTFMSSLLAFNVGIEVGQLVIIATALPFIFFFRNARWYPRFIKISAIVISLIAIFWFFQRIFS